MARKVRGGFDTGSFLVLLLHKKGNLSQGFRFD